MQSNTFKLNTTWKSQHERRLVLNVSVVLQKCTLLTINWVTRNSYEQAGLKQTGACVTSNLYSKMFCKRLHQICTMQAHNIIVEFPHILILGNHVLTTWILVRSEICICTDLDQRFYFIVVKKIKITTTTCVHNPYVSPGRFSPTHKLNVSIESHMVGLSRED